MDTENLLAQIPFLPQSPETRAAVIFAAAIVVAFVARFAFRHLVHRLTKSTDTDRRRPRNRRSMTHFH